LGVPYDTETVFFCILSAFSEAGSIAEVFRERRIYKSERLRIRMIPGECHRYSLSFLTQFRMRIAARSFCPFLRVRACEVSVGLANSLSVVTFSALAHFSMW
jgi:hypothetical protein